MNKRGKKWWEQWKPKPGVQASAGGLSGEMAKVSDPVPPKPTIEELSAILDREEEPDGIIQILPNGEVRAASGGKVIRVKGKKPLTFRENIGGEYAYV